jgi:hypothetical protein
MAQQPVFKVRIYSDHAIVNSTTLISPLKNLGARLLEMAGEAQAAPVKVRRKRKAKKVEKSLLAPKKRGRRKKVEKAEGGGASVAGANVDALAGTGVE